jgi:hypothetical protein
MLASSTLCAQAVNHSRLLPNVSSVSWKEETLGEILGVIWKVSIIICLILLVVDAVQRFGGKKLGPSGLFHSVRFIWFIYGSASLYSIGAVIPLAYREFMGNIYREFFLEIFDSYFGIGYVNIFNNPIRVNGAEIQQSGGNNGLLENIIFFELIIFIVLRVGALILSKGLKDGNPLSNLVGTLRRAFGFFFGLYFWYMGLNFYQFMKTLSDLNETSTVVTKRSHFNVWLSWAIAIYTQIEVVWSMVEVFIAAYKGKAGKSQTYEEGNNPGATGVAKIQNSYDTTIDEVAFMFQNKAIATKNIFSQFYNSFVFLRWILYVLFATTFTHKPRSVGILLVFGGVVAVVWTIGTFKSFRRLPAILILLSEIFLLLRHSAQIINLGDQLGADKMSQFWTDFLTHTAFWSYIFGTIIEFVLIFEPIISGHKSADPVAVSAEMEFDIKSNHDLENRVSTYKTMKSRSGPKPGSSALKMVSINALNN